jgi:hypothetical protein
LFKDLPQAPLVVGDVVLKEDALLDASALQEVYFCGVDVAVKELQGVELPQQLRLEPGGPALSLISLSQR